MCFRVFLRVHPNVRKWLRDSWLLGMVRGRLYRGRQEVLYQGESGDSVSGEAGEVGRVERDMKERKNAPSVAKI